MKLVFKKAETCFQNAGTRFQNAKTALSRIFFARTWMDSAQKKAWFLRKPISNNLYLFYLCSFSPRPGRCRCGHCRGLWRLSYPVWTWLGKGLQAQVGGGFHRVVLKTTRGLKHDREKNPASQAGESLYDRLNLWYYDDFLWHMLWETVQSLLSGVWLMQSRRWLCMRRAASFFVSRVCCCT